MTSGHLTLCVKYRGGKNVTSHFTGYVFYCSPFVYLRNQSGLVQSSSIGSNSRKHCEHRPQTTARSNFQYPQSDRTRGNLSSTPNSVYVPISFSILNRIELAETPMRCCAPASGGSFSILNRIELAETALMLIVTVFEALSVSSIGSNSRKRRQGLIAMRFTDFQYPQSDRTRGNVHLTVTTLPHSPLSVSSIGSNSRKPMRMPVSIDESEIFQYPQSDRTRGNGTCHCPPASSGMLSVSSIGSNSRKPCAARGIGRSCYSFSILNRIELAETGQL